MTEERIVDPLTGGEKGRKLERFDLIPVGPLTEVARLYGTGASKYADRNWELGYAWSLSYAALMRHLTQFWAGESRDPEGGRHHLSAVIFHAMALMEFEAKGKGTDDRPLPFPLSRPLTEEERADVASRIPWLDPAPPLDSEIESRFDLQPEPHRHYFGDHLADSRKHDHTGCVPCYEPGCKCHHKGY